MFWVLLVIGVIWGAVTFFSAMRWVDVDLRHCFGQIVSILGSAAISLLFILTGMVDASLWLLLPVGLAFLVWYLLSFQQRRQNTARNRIVG